MRRPRNASGYTIIEVMIFLTISAAMFGAVVGTLIFQNRRNEFTESVQTFDQRLQDILNDVDTGYFPSNSDFSCKDPNPGVTTGSLTIDPSSGAEQGTNQECVFAGKSISRDAINPSNYTVKALVGRRTSGDPPQEVTNISDAKITSIDGGTAAGSDSGVLSAEVQITKILSKSIGAPSFSGDFTTFGVLTGFAQTAGVTSLKSGNIKSSLAVFASTTWDTNTASGGVLICLAEPGGGRKATIQIGGDNSGQKTTQVTIDSTAAECSS